MLESKQNHHWYIKNTNIKCVVVVRLPPDAHTLYTAHAQMCNTRDRASTPARVIPSNAKENDKLFFTKMFSNNAITHPHTHFIFGGDGVFRCIVARFEHAQRTYVL